MNKKSKLQSKKTGRKRSPTQPLVRQGLPEKWRLKPGDRVLTGELIDPSAPRLTPDELLLLRDLVNPFKIAVGSHKRLRGRRYRENSRFPNSFNLQPGLLSKMQRQVSSSISIFSNNYDQPPKPLSEHLAQDPTVGKTVLHLPYFSKRYAHVFPHRLLIPGCVVHIAHVGYKGFIRLNDTPFLGSRAFCVVGGRPDRELMLRHALPSGEMNNLIRRLVVLLNGHLSPVVVRRAVRAQVEKFNPAHLYQREKRESKPIGVLASILDRLDLCASLSTEKMTDELNRHQLSLVIYLYLTCFDLLGQPNEWMTFDSWLNGKKVKIRAEREAALQDLAPQTDQVLAAQALQKRYAELYGVKSSFYRFIDEILSPADRKELFDGIRYSANANVYPIGEPVELGEKEKKDYLFKLRNGYTHRARYNPGVTMPPRVPVLDGHEGRHFMHYEQFFDSSNMVSILFSKWPEMLRQAVVRGLVCYAASLAE